MILGVHEPRFYCISIYAFMRLFYRVIEKDGRGLKPLDTPRSLQLQPRLAVSKPQILLFLVNRANCLSGTRKVSYLTAT